MKHKVLWALLLSLLCAAPSMAARCSEGANCTACSNCSGCAHCGKRGGTCSVCRPDLYAGSFQSPGQSTYRAPQRATRQTYNAAPVSPPRRQRTTRRTVTRTRQTTPAPMSSFVGRCVGVSDGDTIKVLVGQQTITVRLYGVDCPEKKQAFGERAKQFASGFAFGKSVTIYSRETDRYGRTLGWAFVAGKCLNAELVSNGLAWWYRQYAPKETKLAAMEQQARSAKRGLWADAGAVAPWDWRRGTR